MMEHDDRDAADDRRTVGATPPDEEVSSGGVQGDALTEGLLEVEGLSKSYGAVVAADDISLTFERGECHGIIGPNGAGKTTVFDLVSGFQSPDSGVVRFEGEDVTGMRPDLLARRGLVRTFQVVSPFEGLTVRENLHSVYTDGLRSSIRVPEETVERAEDVIETLDLADVADHEASDLSGGQQKLLELGRALMLDPACLLLDEPTAGVNPAIQERVLDVLCEINDRGTTVVIIEHDMNVIGDLADRVTVLDSGRIIAQGDFDSITADDRVRGAYIGHKRDGMADVGEDFGSPVTDRTGSAPDQAEAPGSASDPDDEPDSTPDQAEDSPPAATNGGVASHPPAASLAATDAGDNQARLVTRDVVAGYGSQVVLDGVSIRSRDGVTCIFGPNGSGKSTLLQTIGGVVPAWSGEIRYGGQTITGWNPHEIVRAGITTVPQREQVFRGLTVRENLQLGGTTVADSAVIDERMDAVLDVFPELETALAQEARSLSGGQQVMLGVARAMMTGADVYLLDEPLSGLAPSVMDSVLDVIDRLVDQGTQVVLVEQQVREALRIADHVYVLSQGQIQFDGTPADLRDEDELVDLYLGIQ
jgi:branched-chain amino acid transport system ATP-binding protein